MLDIRSLTLQQCKFYLLIAFYKASKQNPLRCAQTSLAALTYRGSAAWERIVAGFCR